MYELKVITHFAAAHQLKMVGEKCENMHGHNWKIEICLTGETLNAAGVLMDFGEIKQHVSEVMTNKYITESLQLTINDPSVKVTSVSAWESEDSCATYIV